MALANFKCVPIGTARDTLEVLNSLGIAADRNVVGSVPHHA